MPRVSVNDLPTEPITAVGVVSSLNKALDDYYVVAQTTDGSDADLWKDGLFKSKVTRYLCFTRKPGSDVVVDVKLTDMKEALPEGFTHIQETLDSKEPAMRKRRLCVKISPCEAAEMAVYDIQITAKSKHHLVHYTCIGKTIISRPVNEHKSSGSYTMTAMDDVPFGINQKFYDPTKEMQRVNLMGITIKSLAQIEEEFDYSFSTEQSVVV